MSMYSDGRVVYFDGVCNLCNGFVQFLIKHDKAKRLRFASLQSDAGKAMLSKYGKSNVHFDSVVFLVGERVMEKSTAALHVLRAIGGFWSLAYGFIIVPKVFRDWVYDVVARNRYRWFGKRDECMLPSPELLDRFLD